MSNAVGQVSLTPAIAIGSGGVTSFSDKQKIKWARGYYAGTAGHVSSETVQDYIQRQEADA